MLTSHLRSARLSIGATHYPPDKLIATSVNEKVTPMMNGMQGMGWGMGTIWILVVIALVLGIAALVKYLFFSARK
jgi:hypothetical protein